MPEGHLVRIVKQVGDAIEVKPISRKARRRSIKLSPVADAELLVYGCLGNTYPRRKLEEQAAQHVYFMWLLR